MRVFVINPGSTSTKIALYHNGRAEFYREFQHEQAELARFGHIVDQRIYRMDMIRGALEEEGLDTAAIDGIVGRGGLLRPMEGGVYKVSDAMLNDLQHAKFGEHPCNLGAIMADELAREWGVPACIVDPVVTDELDDVARITGLPVIRRRSLLHALSQRGSARTVADALGVTYEASNFIVAHLGGGCSIGAHRRGRVVEVVNALDGEGPFTPERAGGLPVLMVLDLIESGKATPARLKKVLLRQSGLIAHLGTNDLREVEHRMDEGDERAAMVFHALAYSTARHIGSLAPVLTEDDGSLDLTAVILTGGLARSERLTNEIRRMVAYLGPVKVVLGDEEMAAMADGCVRMLKGEEQAAVYSG